MNDTNMIVLSRDEWDVLKQEREARDAEIARLKQELEAIKPKPVKRTGWVNVYVGTYGSPFDLGYPCDTREEADKTAKCRIACIEISFEEGEGL